MALVLIDSGGPIAVLRATVRVRGTGAAAGVWHVGLFVNGAQAVERPFSNKEWETYELPLVTVQRGASVDVRVYRLAGEASAPAEIAEWRLDDMCQISCSQFEGGIIAGDLPIADGPCDPCAGGCPDCGGDFPGDFEDPFDGGGDFVDPGEWDPGFEEPDFPPWEEPFDPGDPYDDGDYEIIPDPIADTTIEDPIPGGVFDRPYYMRGFVTVPSYAEWAPGDELQIFGLRTGDAVGSSIDDLPGVEIHADGKLYGTHAATTGVPLAAGAEHCVECKTTVNGDDGSIDQEIFLDGASVGSVQGADPDSGRDPPVAAVVGAGPSDNPNLVVYIGDPVWNENPIGCSTSWDPSDPDPGNEDPGEGGSGGGDPIYPGEPGYPWEPSDGVPPYGEPYYPPDTAPIYPDQPGYPFPEYWEPGDVVLPGDPNYPYEPGDPEYPAPYEPYPYEPGDPEYPDPYPNPDYGEPYYPPPEPGDTGGPGAIEVSVSAPVDGTVLSADPLLISAAVVDGSSNGGVSFVEVWLDNVKLGDAYGDPPVFFWEWGAGAVDPGPHQIRVVAVATSGARVYSPPVTVHVPDLEQPDVAFLSPAAAATVAGLVEVAVEADDNVEIDSVEFWLDDVTRLGPPLTSPPYRVTVDTDDLSPGAHTLRAVARDAAGNVAEATRAFSVGSTSLTPWDYETVAAPHPRLRVEIDFANDPFVQPFRDAILATQPWLYWEMEEDPASTPFALDSSGWGHAGTSFGDAWSADGGGWRTTAFRTNGILLPVPSRRPSFGFAIRIRPRSFGSEFPMRILDTVALGGLRLTIQPDGAVRVDGVISSEPGVVPAGGPARTIAFLYDADNTTVGTALDPVSPGPRSSMTILVDGDVVAQKAPLSTADAIMMARSSGNDWTIGGGAGDATIYDVIAWMRPVGLAEVKGIVGALTNPPAPPAAVWTDVTSRVVGPIDLQRQARVGELEHAPPGTATLTLRNNDRALEPENPASPYYPGVIAGRRIRIQAFRDAVWKPVWSGHVDKWPVTWGLRRAAVTLTCSGRMVKLAHAADVSADFSRELTGARLDRVLAAAGIPETERILDPGKLTVLGHRVESVGARDYANRLADGELGSLFEAADGSIVFHDRDRRVTDPRSALPQAVLGDGGPTSGELPYVEAIPDHDEERVINDVRVEWPRGTTQVALDAASRSRHGPKTVTIQTLLSSERSAARLARTVLDLAREPRWRFVAVTIDPSRLDALWDLALDTEISDRLTVVRRPPGGGDPLRLATHVESIRHSIMVGEEGRATEWRVTFGLSTVGRAAPAALTAARTVVAPAAAATAASVGPAVAKLSSPTIAAPPAAAIATRPPPGRSVFVVSPAAAATAARVAPSIGQLTRQAPAAAATAAAPKPSLSQATIAAPVAAATASRPVPVPALTLPVVGDFSEALPTLIVSDGFDRPDVNPLPTTQGWVAYGGTGNSPFRIISNEMAVITAGAIRRAWWSPGGVNGAPSGAPQNLYDVFATVAVKPGDGEYVGVMPRLSGPHITFPSGYEFRVLQQAGTDIVEIVRRANSPVEEFVLATGTFELAAGDTLLARSHGGHVWGYIVRGGSVVYAIAGSDYTTGFGKGPFSDSSRRGVLMSGTTGRLDSFGIVPRPRTLATAPLPANWPGGIVKPPPAHAFAGAFLRDTFSRSLIYKPGREAGDELRVAPFVTVESVEVDGSVLRLRSASALSLSQRVKLFTDGRVEVSAARNWEMSGRFRLVDATIVSHTTLQFMLGVGDTVSFAPRQFNMLQIECDEEPFGPVGGQSFGTVGPRIGAFGGYINSSAVLSSGTLLAGGALDLGAHVQGGTSPWWRFRWRSVAGKVTAALWPDGDPEPEPQMFGTLSISSGGPFGIQVYGGNGGHDVTWEIDDLVVAKITDHVVHTGLVKAPPARALGWRGEVFT